MPRSSSSSSPDPAMFSPPKSYSVSASPVTKPLSIRLVRTPLKELVPSPKRKRESSPEIENPSEKRVRRGSRSRTPTARFSLDLTPEENSPTARLHSRQTALQRSGKRRSTPLASLKEEPGEGNPETAVDNEENLSPSKGGRPPRRRLSLTPSRAKQTSSTRRSTPLASLKEEEPSPEEGKAGRPQRRRLSLPPSRTTTRKEEEEEEESLNITPLKSCYVDLSPENELLSTATHRSGKRLSLTPSLTKRTPSNRRRTQSDRKKMALSPIGEHTPLKRNPAVRRLIQEGAPSTPRTNRRNLRAPSLSPQKQWREELLSLEELQEDHSDLEEDSYVAERSCSSDDDDFKEKKKKVIIDTKKKTKKKTTPKKKTRGRTPSTPKRSTLTPKAQDRKVPLPLDVSDIQEAQLRLHVSAVPESLPCREKEFEEIYNFTEGKIIEESGGCMYISGVPGTGKTATVKEVIRKLSSDDVIPQFTFIEINGMRLTEPNQAYTQIWRELCPNRRNGSKITSEHAQSLLDKKFSTPCESTVVLLVDELDMLCTTRRQNVLYNLFDWPNRSGSNLVVLAIANTMDLPERVMLNRVSSRLGLTRLTFSPYTHHQLQEIVATRLRGLEIFDKDAVQLVARKVASLSGDARRALDICRRATEIAERRSGELVSLADVAEAHKEMFSSSKITAIRSCSTHEKIFLRSILSEFHRTGIEETTFDRVWREMTSMIHYEGLSSLPLALGLDLAYRLSSSKLIIAEHCSKGLGMKIQLHASVDDVQFALRGGESK